MARNNDGLLQRVSHWLGLTTGRAAEPDLGVTWMLLPPYDIPGMAVVSGLLVENQGEADVEGVYIALVYPGERFITHMEVASDDRYTLQGGGPRDSRLTLRLELLRAGHKVVIYVAGHSTGTPDVTVSIQRVVSPKAG